MSRFTRSRFSPSSRFHWLIPTAGLAIAGLMTGCGGSPTTGSSGLSLDPNNPESLVGRPISALIDNDVATLMNALPAEQLAEAKQQWPEMRTEMGQQLAMAFPMIATEDGVNQIKSLVRSQVEANADQFKQQLGMASMMLNGLVSQASSSLEGDAAQKAQEQGQALIAGLGEWIETAGLDNADNAVAAVDTLIAAVKATGVSSVDQWNALSFDEAMQHAGTLVGGLKGALNTYQLDVDGILKSISVTTQEQNGDNATLAVGATIFGVELDNTVEVSKASGSWMPVP